MLLLELEGWDLLEEGEIDIPTEIKTPDDAKRTLAAIRGVSEDLSKLHSDHDNVKKAADDLMKAVQVLQAKDFEASAPVVGSNEAELASRYLDSDGSVRLLGKERSFEFGGQTFRAYEPGLLDDPDSTCKWQEDVKKAVSKRNMARLLMKSPSTPMLDGEVALLLARAPAARGFRKALEAQVKSAFEARTKAFSNSSGAGAEWIPEQFIADLYEAFVVRGDLRAMFPEVSVNSDSFRRPRVSNTVRPYIQSQITSDNPANFTASTPTTADESYTVPGLAVRILADAVSVEDSAIAAVPRLSRLGSDGIQDGIRDCLLNGDTTATHEDTIASWNLRSRWGSSGLGGSADHRRAWKGLRRQAVDRSTTLDMGSLQTAAGVLQLVALLGERAASSLRIVTSPEVVIQKLMGLSEVLTMDKFGTRATIVSGQIADLFNIPIIPTRFMGADLAATGLYTGSGAKSGLLVVDTNGYYWVNRRAEVVEIQKVIVSGHYEIVITIRLGFDTPDDSTAKNVAYGYNWL